MKNSKQFCLPKTFIYTNRRQFWKPWQQIFARRYFVPLKIQKLMQFSVFNQTICCRNIFTWKCKFQCCQTYWYFMFQNLKVFVQPMQNLFRKIATLFPWRKVFSELSAWQRETCFDYPAKNNSTKVRKKLIAKQRKVMETFNGKRFAKQSCWHAGCFDNDTVKKNLPWFGKQTVRSLKIGKMKLFLTELFTQTFVCTDTKHSKKIPIEILTRHSEQFSHNVRQNFKRWEFFCEKKLFTRKSSGDSDCSFEKCVAKVRPEVQEKSHSKLENNWKFLTFKNRSWLIKTNLCTENRYFPKPRQRISSRQ